MWGWLLLAFLLLALRSSKPLLTQPAPGSIEDLARAAAARHDIPPWLLLATGQVESGLRSLPPNDDGGSLTFYPYGIKLVRAREVWPQVTEPELRDLQTQTEIAAMELARGWARYGPDDVQVRAWWKRPASGHQGEPYPESWGDGWRNNWEAAVERWRAA